ncbi:MAG: UDP-N-acetylglucosamine--N-acetylmuramyl-(pentapeptide) pyrophosphoryl-undecaprenol N-acetylglucosamine transferase [bacterium]|nr:UDP-N-acetylglucosamine--N-acetylmuramyl-(pentapeptide) pyrophosphoryl-undecaprenol N-acetylglucosamine transferase [bacterium]
MKSYHRILLTGGGTGGHVHPAIAVGEALLQIDPNTSILYAGSGLPERDLIPPSMKYVEFKSIGLPKIYSLRFVRFLLTLGVGTLHAIIHLLKFKPTAVFSTGGYVSAPSIFATTIISKLKLLGRSIPIIVFEPNAEPGRMNQLIQRFATRISVTSEIAKNVFHSENVFVDGYPIRWNIEHISKTEARNKLSIPENAIVILAFGGSMGARTLNHALLKVWNELRKNENVYLMLAAGRKKSDDFDPIREVNIQRRKLGLENDHRLIVVESFDDMSIPYSAADIVVSRAGAGTIAEICHFGKAAILIPKSNLPLDHQAVNAFSMQSQQKALVVYEKIVLCNNKIETIVPWQTLYRELNKLIEQPYLRHRLGQQAKSNVSTNAKIEIAEKLLFYSAGTKDLHHKDSTKHTIEKNQLPIGLNAIALRNHFEKELLNHSISWKWTYLYSDQILQKEFPKIPSIEVIQSVPFYDYYCYRGNAMLGNESWEVQNEGIKLSALCLNHEVLPILLNWIRDRRPTTWLKRKMGGDFQTVGFLRRNATAAIPAFHDWSEEVLLTLVFALSDPYWEVRTAAARTLARLPKGINTMDYDRMVDAIEKTLTYERHYEVLAATWIAYGYILQRKPLKEFLDRYLVHPNDLVRTSLMFAIELLIQKGVQFEEEELNFILNKILMTTSQFTPSFGLRSAIANFQKTIAESKCSIG